MCIRDSNFSGDVQADAHRFTEVLFGKGKAFRAGTLGALADKTAFGYVMKYLEEKHVSVNRAECDRMVSGIAGVKRTTGPVSYTHLDVYKRQGGGRIYSRKYRIRRHFARGICSA